MPFNWKAFLDTLHKQTVESVKDVKAEVAIALTALIALVGTVSDYLTGWLGVFQ